MPPRSTADRMRNRQYHVEDHGNDEQEIVNDLIHPALEVRYCVTIAVLA